MPVPAFLVERVLRVYVEQPDLRRLVDESVIDALGLTPAEGIVLACLLVGGTVEGGLAYAASAGLGKGTYTTLVNGLKESELIDIRDGEVDFGPTENVLRVETEWDRIEGSPKLVLRPLAERLLLLAQSNPNPVAGLARVYSFLFGSRVQQKDYPVLGIYVKELGLDQAVYFFLEHVHESYPNPLKALLPLAKARAKGFRPATAPQECEQQEWEAHITALAREKHARRAR